MKLSGTPADLCIDGRTYHYLNADTRPFLFLPKGGTWICGTIPRESHAELTFRINALLKQGGYPRDAKWSEEFELLLESLPDSEGIDFDVWHSGRVWLDVGVVNFWEELVAADFVREMLLALNRRPKGFRVN